ncbi:DUF234 domain-containing protein [Campylobacter suis]|uniref:DUF234 domain-containing protein n=1 Tax=Campylobacter suis TaxID=2790657 RepID=A0ABM8Q8H9_9BACT|nr:DUF234 domain-containing protein [Campylobacter suis]CAD7289158.1 hypothetical protein LMG8286_01680 [Campylobacter suis]
MKHLDIDDVFNFHIVFDEIVLSKAYYDVFEAIEGEIFANIKELKKRFEFDDELSEPMKKALLKLANSDRKRFSINKALPQILASKTFAKLLENGLIYIEKSREIRPVKAKNQKLKKSERRYIVQDKVHFTSHFTRFWFRFIQPNLAQLENGEFSSVMQTIKAEFYEYASLGFELLCAEFLRDRGVKNANSFWHKNIEIDLLGIGVNGIVVAEAKFRAKKVCKSILTLLLTKCERLGFVPNEVYLFSKSGFSKELENLGQKRVKLINLNQMTELLE